jgi:hypothetical protein
MIFLSSKGFPKWAANAKNRIKVVLVVPVQLFQSPFFSPNPVGDTGFEPATSSTPNGYIDIHESPIIIGFHAGLITK